GLIPSLFKTDAGTRVNSARVDQKLDLLRDVGFRRVANFNFQDCETHSKILSSLLQWYGRQSLERAGRWINRNANRFQCCNTQYWLGIVRAKDHTAGSYLTHERDLNNTERIFFDGAVRQLVHSHADGLPHS